MADKVKCQYCSEKVDKTAGPFGVKRKRGANTYCHVGCIGDHPNWEISPALPPENSTKYVYKPPVNEFEDENLANIHTTLKNHLGDLYSKKKIQKELNRMIADGKTYQGIAYSIVYWVKELGHDLKEYNGSLSIIDYIYGDARKHYERKKENGKKNKDTTIDSCVKETREVVIKKTEMTKPLRVKMFELD